MAFQERMSSTEMQRRVQDLLAAGLNPMLAGANQQGASSAQGASTRVDPITRNSASSALAMQMQRSQLENINQQTRLLQEQQANTRADTALKDHTAHQSAMTSINLEHQSMALAQDIKRKVIEIGLTDEQLRNAKLTNDQLEQMQPLLEQFQRLKNEAERLGMSERQMMSDWFERVGELSPAMKAFLTIINSRIGAQK